MDHPFGSGRFVVGVRSARLEDSTRNRVFPCEIWFPEGEFERYPLILFSHPSGANRRSATFLCEHLCSHGYLVAAMDHSEVVAPELARREGETAEERSARWNAVMGSRVPDIRLLLNFILRTWPVDTERIGIVGHSFGGWTALATPDVEPRIRAVVALPPGGASNPKPGILPLKLAFDWVRDVPTLFLVAENDTSLPLGGMYEIFARTPATKRMFVLRRADHLHFVDDVEAEHERVRKMWAPSEMLPITELTSGEQAHAFIRGLTLGHFDAFLRGLQHLTGDDEAQLKTRKINAFEHRS